MKRANYTKENLTKAVDDYKNGFTSTEISIKYGVPSSTIRNHKSKPELKIGGGRPTVITKDQEKYLVELFKNLETIGVRLTKLVVLQLATDFIKFVTGNVFNKISFQWLCLINLSNISNR